MMTLTTACDRFVHYKMFRQAKAPGTGQNIKRHVGWFIRWLLVQYGDERLSRMTTENVEAFIEHRRARVKSAHLTGIILRQFAKWGAEPKQRLWAWDQVAGIEVPKAPRQLPKPFRPEERDRLLDLPLTGSDALLRGLLYMAGLRNSEAANVRLKDVTEPYTMPTGQVILGRLYIVGKGAKERAVDIHPALWPLIDERMKEMGAGPLDRTLLVNRYGAKLSCKAIQKRCRQWGKVVGLTKSNPHRWRHTFATDALASSPGQLETLQKTLGHSSPATTMGYAQVSDERRASFISRLPMRVSGPSITPHTQDGGPVAENVNEIAER